MEIVSRQKFIFSETITLFMYAYILAILHWLFWMTHRIVTDTYILVTHFK